MPLSCGCAESALLLVGLVWAWLAQNSSALMSPVVTRSLYSWYRLGLLFRSWFLASSSALIGTEDDLLSACAKCPLTYNYNDQSVTCIVRTLHTYLCNFILDRQYKGVAFSKYLTLAEWCSQPTQHSELIKLNTLLKKNNGSDQTTKWLQALQNCREEYINGPSCQPYHYRHRITSKWKAMIAQSMPCHIVD